VVCKLRGWDIVSISGAYDAGTLNATRCFAERADRAPLFCLSLANTITPRS
jgi:hypothetical protein